MKWSRTRTDRTKPTLTKIVMTFGGDPEAAVSYERGDLDSPCLDSTGALS
jgi:hypothetical protein